MRRPSSIGFAVDVPRRDAQLSGMASKFQIQKSSDGQFRFNLKAANGEIILTSELYKQKASALGGVDSVKKNALLV